MYTVYNQINRMPPSSSLLAQAPAYIYSTHPSSQQHSILPIFHLQSQIVAGCMSTAFMLREIRRFQVHTCDPLSVIRNPVCQVGHF